MPVSDHVNLEQFMEGVKKRNPGQPEFVQAVHEVAQDIFEFMADKVEYHEAQILRRIAEPDRIVSFRVCWEDDNHNIRVQRGWRVQNNNAIGPYKGGIRFHPSVTESVLKFLAFEQTFKNSLTGLPMGGGKGGANFNPKGKSDAEVMRFCQSFMTELYRHIGPDTDVPAGDIGVGGREIGYMFGQYKRITGRWEGVLTGKGQEYGGSQMRPEATGYGAVYFLQNMLKHKGMDVEGHSAVISGSGNVATHAAEKIVQLGGKVLTLSDSGGFIHDPDGITQEKIDWVKHLKNVKRGRISEYVDEFSGATYHEGERPWSVAADLALPCATQNELNEDEAKALVDNGVKGVSEGANMPTTLEGVKVFHDAKIMYGPGKAANAGGVAVSGLEMSQNSERISWNHERLGEMLTDLMAGIHEKCTEYGDQGDGYVDYVKGANIAGFKKVADAMLAFGVV
ncbi:NADP-specific glutamate dehydrogenase [Erythrobacter sp. SCSIO 43205]|uniref:NADP-specific glutamate dehydrogenase n=1 Tax=Erythrobacter sp. SCSIO 43205 TaxID=2779361 RepID=UPI001CA8E1DB|nr:NADP-specific glutamate dehydrogenase [Erythrobacter sp. SCSIO 43205]UAB78038.1 NADP-specific glutamate dehydrogenase [Erythrobacter sp. SCSIO 43205]